MAAPPRLLLGSRQVVFVLNLGAQGGEERGGSSVRAQNHEMRAGGGGGGKGA